MKSILVRVFSWFLSLLIVVAILGMPVIAVQETGLRFDRDIRPILSDKCYACHGPDAKERKANLRLDTEVGALTGQTEEPVIVPGQPDQSKLIQRITHPDSTKRMPPASYNRELTMEEIALLKQWIAEGAKWEEHWLYTPPQRSELPPVSNRSWPENEIDHFIQRRLESEGIAPSPTTDKQTLIRRLSFDLTGLPPAYEDVEAFVNDDSLEAYQKVVERLLNSPHYGERMALYWLDLVRYADTTGYHSDENVSVWPYRDYVIRAFNENMPFDQFTRENLAGDLLDNSTVWQKVAAGYNRLNQTTAEGGAQAKEYLAIYSADRVRTTASVWLGATMGCAQCHDHKFDPYTTQDFYRLAAFFADIKEVGVYGGNSKREPIVRILDETQQAEHDRLVRELEKRQAEYNALELTDSQKRWEIQTVKDLSSKEPVDFGWIDDKQNNGGKTQGKWQFVDKSDAPVFSGQFSRRQTGNAVVQHYFHEAGRKFTLSEGEHLFAYVWLDPDNPPQTVMLQFNDGDWNHRAFWGEDKIGFGVIGRDGPDHRPMGDLPPKGKWVRLEVEPEVIGLKLGSQLNGMGFVQYGGLAYWDKSGLRTTIANQTRALHPTSVLSVLEGDQTPTDEQKKQVTDHYRTIAPELKELRDTIQQFQSEQKELIESAPYSLTVEAVEPRAIRILPRGDWMDDSGEIVTPGTPEFLPSLQPLDSPADSWLSRTDLADWILSRQNPLTSRVFVNRLWYLFFGTGISKVLDDLGAQGEAPVHPELLDWLAVEFMDNSWNIKQMVKKIVMSQTYRQSSSPRPELQEQDPYNRLLARQDRFRLDAEVIRDSALAISGLLVRRIGGPSVNPYQPKGYYANLNFPKRVYQHDSGEKQYRRGMYTHWQRTFPHPSMVAFDAPSRQECVAERPYSNTPIQALTLLNDPSYIESARVFAGQILRHGGSSTPERVNWAFQRALSRSASEEELSVIKALYDKHWHAYQQESHSAQLLANAGEKERSEGLADGDLAAWTSVARVVLNLNESISRY